jgi:two-component system nitrogen regulation response regulator NtrX
MAATNLIKNKKVLIVDDHKNIRVSLQLTLEGEGAEVTEAINYSSASQKIDPFLENIDEFPYEVVLLDIRMPDGSGLDLLKKMSDAGLSSRVIMISGEGTVSDAFKATQMGAFDYVEKPFAEERILVTVARCLKFNNLSEENKSLSSRVDSESIIGSHPLVEELKESISKVAKTKGRVLILGESGTGKELVSKQIHQESDRAKKTLIKINCAAIPHNLIESELFGHEKGAFTGALKARKGLFEQANGSTLFLDEIGELSLDVQAKLLRVLQTGELSRLGSEDIKKVDVRVIAATHRDLEEMVESGEFREDLFYRLNVVTIKTPALRDRPTDIRELAEFFLKKACRENALGERSFSNKALKDLEAHSWPGNIRQLQNVVERSAILSDGIEIEQIEGLSGKASSQPAAKAPEAKASPSENFSFETPLVPWQEFHKELDQAYIKYVLIAADGNVSEAARLLCLERAYLHRLMKKLGIQREVSIS